MQAVYFSTLSTGISLEIESFDGRQSWKILSWQSVEDVNIQLSEKTENICFFLNVQIGNLNDNSNSTTK